MNYSRLPSVRHVDFLRGRCYSNVITQQIGIIGAERASLFWPSNLTQLLKVYTEQFIWRRTSELFILLGLASPTQTNAESTETVSDQWKLFQIRCEIDGLVEKRESIIAQFSQDGADHASLQAQLDQANGDLKILAERKDKIKRSIRKNLQDPQTAGSDFRFTDPMAEWTIGLISSLFTEVIFYPFQLSIVWTACQPQATSWKENLTNLLSTVSRKDKNLTDGLVPYLSYIVTRAVLTVPLMKFFHRVFRIPSEAKLRNHLRIFIMAPFQNLEVEAQIPEYLELSNAERKFEIKSGFRALIKNSVAYAISDWLVQTLVFPLTHVHHRVAAQGASFLAPNRGYNVLSQMQFIYQTEGLSGFYRGFRPHFNMLLSELLFWGLFYVGVSIVIEYRMKETDDEDDDDYLTSSV